MKKTVLYKYLGTNGVIVSPVHLEDIYYIRTIHLAADNNKRVTKDGIQLYESITVPEDEVDLWYEVPVSN